MFLKISEDILLSGKTWKWKGGSVDHFSKEQNPVVPKLYLQNVFDEIYFEHIDTRKMIQNSEENIFWNIV